MKLSDNYHLKYLSALKRSSIWTITCVHFLMKTELLYYSGNFVNAVYGNNPFFLRFTCDPQIHSVWKMQTHTDCLVGGTHSDH